jgi:hypothetical protein
VIEPTPSLAIRFLLVRSSLWLGLLQTPPHGDALAFAYRSVLPELWRTFTSENGHMPGVP